MARPGGAAPNLAEAEGERGIDHALAEADAPRHGDRSPREWAKANLFSNVFNAITTVVFGLIGLYLLYRTTRFVFTTARWEPVRVNLELFVVGLFPRSERTRIVSQMLLMSGAAGLLIGWLRQRRIRLAKVAGLTMPTTSLRQISATYWAVSVFVLFSMVVGVGTVKPWLLLIGCVVGATGAFVATMELASPFAKLVVFVPFALAGGVLSLVPDLNNQGAYAIALVAALGLAAVVFARRPSITLSVGLLFAVASFQVLSGTHGLSWMYLTVALLPAGFDLASASNDRVPRAAGWVGTAMFAAAGVLLISMGGVGLVPVAALGLAAFGAFAAFRGNATPGTRLGVVAAAGVVAWQLGRVVDVQGLDWKDWGGLHLNVIVAAATTVMAFPIGVLLALGRRSSLPVLRWMCTTYIEIIRGVPLLALLFMAQFFVGYFLDGNNLPLVTKAIIVFTMFSAAYIAEIVRGGLQSIGRGQTEAGQAMGMSPAAITRLLVLPQALKNVIPAMVGQFISLFKDTSLLFVIGIPEFLGIRGIVHAQADFRGFGIAETLVYVAFGFWAFAFTMSRESQRLERRLDVGG